MVLQVQGNKPAFVVLLAILIIGAVAAAVAVSLLLIGVSQTKSSLVQDNSAQARVAAESCIEEALEQIREDANYSGTVTLAVGNASCQYTVVKGSGEARTITASATSMNVVRKVRVTVGRIFPTIEITSWQEVADF